MNRHLSRRKLVLRIIKAACCITLSKMEVENTGHMLFSHAHWTDQKFWTVNPVDGSDTYEKSITKKFDNRKEFKKIYICISINLQYLNTDNSISRSYPYEFEGSSNCSSNYWNGKVRMSMRGNRFHAATRRNLRFFQIPSTNKSFEKNLYTKKCLKNNVYATNASIIKNVYRTMSLHK